MMTTVMTTMMTRMMTLIDNDDTVIVYSDDCHDTDMFIIMMTMHGDDVDVTNYDDFSCRYLNI